MSVNRASEVWKEIKPFAIRDMNRMLDNKAGDSGDDLYAIILYDESAQKIKYYSMSFIGLFSALSNSESGDIIFVPAGTIGIETIQLSDISVTSESGETITGLTPGSYYTIQNFNGPWNDGGYLHYAYQLSVDGGSTWSNPIANFAEYGLTIDPDYVPAWAISREIIDTYYASIYFQATTSSIKIRVSDTAGNFGNNSGSLSYRIEGSDVSGTVIIPSGVELVGLGSNSIINGSVDNGGILTNIQVTGAITGSGISRMVPNPTVESFSNQIKSLVTTGTSPFSIASTTVNNNLNADLLDGEHATAFAEAVHNHTESDISDLDHDAQKINGVPVDLTGIEDGETLVYDAYEDKIVPGEGGSGASAISDLTDVDLTGLADGDVLIYDETSGDWLPETPASGSSLTVEEQDGTPSISDVNKIKVTNGTLTDDGSGVVSLDFGSAATDGSAIHDNEANEISAITEKSVVVDDDLFIIEDSEASYVKKKVKASNLPGGSGASEYICIQDQKSQGTQGGTFTSGAWQTRDLNTEVSDDGNNASLSSNQITLEAGTYRCQIRCPACYCEENQARLQNITDNATILTGTSERSQNSMSRITPSYSMIVGQFTLAAQKVVEVQHRCQVSRANDGFGEDANFGTEIYTIAEFWKVS